GLNVVKASVFRRWPVTAPYRGEQTTRLTGGHDFLQRRRAGRRSTLEKGHKKSSRWVGPEGERLSLSIKRWN
ncbi:MAG: hypothetical protein KH230_11780, partial [Enterocloster asparagiformis]|nr:hypothetical protein [Enterocloster asparagiformis]